MKQLYLIVIVSLGLALFCWIDSVQLTWLYLSFFCFVTGGFLFSWLLKRKEVS